MVLLGFSPYAGHVNVMAVGVLDFYNIEIEYK